MTDENNMRVFLELATMKIDNPQAYEKTMEALKEVYKDFTRIAAEALVEIQKEVDK